MWRLTAVVVGLLLLLSGLAWAALVKQSESMAMSQMAPSRSASTPGAPAPSDSMPGMSAAPEPGTPPGGSHPSPASGLRALLAVKPGMSRMHPGLFLAIWVVMMVAMMFPSVAPMVIGFAHTSRNKASPAAACGSLGVFVTGYLASWTAVGVAALLLQLLLTRSLQESTSIRVLQVAGGAALIAAGVYQFTRWKHVCLSYCRTPLSFFLHAWRPGITGAFEMGARHGAFCVGCCWGLMLILFTTGLMNLAWMAVLSVVIGVEKLTPVGEAAARIFGGAFVVLGGMIAALS